MVLDTEENSILYTSNNAAFQKYTIMYSKMLTFVTFLLVSLIFSSVSNTFFVNHS